MLLNEFLSYDLGATETLYGIACRYQGEAWVVGAKGTLLYTNDAGVSWSAQVVPTTSDLHGLATQDAGPVFVAGSPRTARRRPGSGAPGASGGSHRPHVGGLQGRRSQRCS